MSAGAGVAGGGARRQFIIDIAANTDSVVRGLRTLGLQLQGLTSTVNAFDTRVGALGQTISRTTDMFRTAGASAEGLAMSFLGIGRNAVQFMDVAIMMNRVGMRGAETFQKMAMNAWQLGHVLGISTQDAGKFLADLVGKFRLSEEAVRRLAGTAAALKQQFGASTEAVAGAATVMPAYVKEMGLSQKNLMGLAAGLERLGLGSREATGMVSNMVRRLGDPKTRWQLNALGLDADKFAKSLRKDGVGAVQELAAATKRLPSVFLAEQFGWSQEEISALQNASSRIGDMTLAMQIANRAAGDGASLSKLFGEATANLADQMKMLWEEVKAVGMRVGLFLMPIVQALVGALRLAIRVISLVPTPILGMIGIFGIMGVMFIGAIFAVGRLAHRLKDLAENFTKSTKAMVGFSAAMSAGRASRSSFLISVRGLEHAVKSLVGTHGVGIAAYKRYALAQSYSIVMSLKRTVAVLREAAVNAGMTKTVWILTKAEWALGVAKSFVTTAMNRGIWAATKSTAAYLYQVGVTKLLAAAQWVLNGAFLANPIGLVVAGVVALVAVFYSLYRMTQSTDKGIRALGYTLLFLLSGPFGMMLGVFLLFRTVVSRIKEAMEGFFSGMYEGFLIVIEPAREAIHGLIRSFAILSDFFTAASDKIFGKGTDIGGMFKTLGKVAMIAFWPISGPLRALAWLFKVVSFSLAVFVDAMRDALAPAIEVVSFAVEELRNAWRELSGVFSTSGPSDWTPVWYAFGKVLLFIFKAALLPIKVGLYLVSSVIGVLAMAFRGLARVVRDVKEALFGSSFLHIAEGIAFVMPVITLLVNLFGGWKNIIDKVRAAANYLWESIKTGVKKAWEFVKEYNPISLLIGGAERAKDAMFGSGFLHILEGSREAVSATSRVARSFSNVASGAMSSTLAVAGMSAAIIGAAGDARMLSENMRTMDGARVAIDSTVSHAMTGMYPPGPEAARARAGAVVSPARMAHAGVPPAIGGRGGAKEITLHIPVNIGDQQLVDIVKKINLDEMIRHHNPPGSSLRGIPL